MRQHGHVFTRQPIGHDGGDPSLRDGHHASYCAAVLQPRRVRPGRCSARRSARTCGAVAAALRRPGGAGRRAHRPPLDLRRSSTPTPTRSPAACSRPGIGRRATGSASGRRTAPEWVLLQYATAKIGAILVNINPAYRTHELALRAAPVRACRLLVSAERSRPATTGRWSSEVRGELRRRWSDVVYIGTPDWDELLVAARRRPAPTATRWPQRDGRRWPSTTRSTSSTPRARPASPRAPRSRHHNILNNGFFVGEGCRYTEHDRVCIPVPFYHCFGMVLGNLACTTHGACIVIPAPGFDPAATLRAVAGRAVHVAVRRADDVHRRAGAARLRQLRPVVAAHRHHGRLAVPGRGDEAGASARCTWTR